MVVTFHEPLLVVALDERPDLALGLGEIAESMQPQALLLQRPHEALDHPVTLRLADERRGLLDAEPAQLCPEGVRRILRAPVGAHGQAARHILAELAEGVPHALVEWLERRPPIAPLRRLPAHELVGRVVDRPEEPAPAVALGPEAGRIRAPELVGPVGRDAPGVGGVAMHMARPPPGEEPGDPR